MECLKEVDSSPKKPVFPPLKASSFSLNSQNYFLEQFSTLNLSTKSSKLPIKFTMGSISKLDRPEFALPEEAYIAIRKSIAISSNHGYTSSTGVPELQKTLAKMFTGPSFPLTEKDVFVTNGTGIALLYCLLAFCNEKDNILVPDIGFPFFINTAKVYNVEVKTYKLDPKANWEIDLADLEKKIDEKSKFVFVVNPGNPMGTVYKKEHLIDLLGLAKKKGIAIVADEIYNNMVFEGVDFVSLGHLTEEVPVVTMCGLDKIFLTGGWSIGWLCFYDRFGVLNEVKKGMVNLAQIFLHPCTFIQHGLIEFFEKVDLNFIKDKIMPFIEESKDLLIKEIKEIKGLEVVVPRGTQYLSVLINLNEFEGIQNDRDFVEKFCEEENVTVVPLSCFHYDTEKGKPIQGFRIMTLGKEEDCIEFVSRLKDFVQKYNRRSKL